MIAVLRRLVGAAVGYQAHPVYWRLMRYMLHAFVVAACGVGGVFLFGALGWQSLAVLSGLVLIGGIASGWLLMMAQMANVFFWRRPGTDGDEGGKADVGRRMSAGRPLSPPQLWAQIESKGQLHDYAVSIKWIRGLSDRLVIHIDDIEANFRGLPEYAGKRSAELALMDAREIEASFAGGDRTVYEAVVAVDGERGRLTLRLWPHGVLIASFSSATLIESVRM